MINIISNIHTYLNFTGQKGRKLLINLWFMDMAITAIFIIAMLSISSLFVRKIR